MEQLLQSADALASLRQAVTIEVRVVAPISPRRWSSLRTQGLAIKSPRAAFSSQAETFSSLLSGFRGPLAYGDRLVFRYDPGAGMAVLVNGAVLRQGSPAELFALVLKLDRRRAAVDKIPRGPLAGRH